MGLIPYVAIDFGVSMGRGKFRESLHHHLVTVPLNSLDDVRKPLGSRPKLIDLCQDLLV